MTAPKTPKLNLPKLAQLFEGEKIALKNEGRYFSTLSDHQGEKGRLNESHLKHFIRKHLPEKYGIGTGFIVSSRTINDPGYKHPQIDIIIYDRHFTPFIFRGENVVYIPAEGVYAVFEVKPHFDKKYYNYAIKKLKSVKVLKRTSAVFTHVQGKSTKELHNIIGGILTKENKSKAFFNKVKIGSDLSFLLSLDSGIKVINDETIEEQDKQPILAFFLLKLIEKLRALGSVPALEVDKYLEFIKK